MALYETLVSDTPKPCTDGPHYYMYLVFTIKQSVKYFCTDLLKKTEIIIVGSRSFTRSTSSPGIRASSSDGTFMGRDASLWYRTITNPNSRGESTQLPSAADNSIGQKTSAQSSSATSPSNKGDECEFCGKVCTIRC